MLKSSIKLPNVIAKLYWNILSVICIYKTFINPQENRNKKKRKKKNIENCIDPDHKNK